MKLRNPRRNPPRTAVISVQATWRTVRSQTGSPRGRQMQVRIPAKPNRPRTQRTRCGLGGKKQDGPAMPASVLTLLAVSLLLHPEKARFVLIGGADDSSYR